MASRNDGGAAEVQKTADKIEEQGFIGQKVDPRPNSDYSLQSGPDSPGVGDGTRAAQHTVGEES